MRKEHDAALNRILGMIETLSKQVNEIQTKQNKLIKRLDALEADNKKS